MTTYYVDSSALVKRYVNETGSDWLQALCTPTAGHTLALAHIGLVELAAALAMKVRQGTLDATMRAVLPPEPHRQAVSTSYGYVQGKCKSVRYGASTTPKTA
ncbi:MAG TPA: type II toxin-antitoxin system VapC family toxin [Anaerolineae bacterium]|nr:type II toxin-antitoxin system VapC family toxin [Anaerolineae bacterium]HQK13908.1 type II toxin-antitoxin system VapC family toxin [Anaerolineae bacterium]